MDFTDDDGETVFVLPVVIHGETWADPIKRNWNLVAEKINKEEHSAHYDKVGLLLVFDLCVIIYHLLMVGYIRLIGWLVS